MARHVLLLGRTPFDIDAAKAAIVAGVELSTGTSLGDVEAIMRVRDVDVVIMGAGIPLGDRLAIVEHIFQNSDDTAVHMKDRASGKAGMMAFVNNVLTPAAD